MFCKSLYLFVISAIYIGTVGCLHVFGGQKTSSKFTPQIYGGDSTVALNKFPYYVSLQMESTSSNVTEHFCGGTIMKSRWILTAAHCIKNVLKRNSVIVVGAKNTRDGSVRHFPQQVIIHDDYKLDEGKLIFDIALIKSRDEILFNENVQPIALNKKWINENIEATVWELSFEKVN